MLIQIATSLGVLFCYPSLTMLILVAIYCRYTRKNKSIAFFHPYCNAGGGGERVLWCAINAMQKKYQNREYRFIVYSGDCDATVSEIVAKAENRFNVKVDTTNLEFVFLRSRWLLEAHYYPRFTMFLQTMAAFYVGLEALFRFCPSIMIDTMGYPTVLPLFKLIGGSKVGCYVHYPTISTDMISLVEKRHTTYNNSGWISESSVFSFIKLWYYKIFALYYRFCGYTTDVVMVNGSWTESHVRSLWKREVAKVFPPCDTTKFLELVNSSEALLEEKKIVQVLSIGQIRPEKNHKLQLDAFNLAREKLNDSSIHLKLVIAGGCRHEDDIARAQDLKDYANKLGIEENVEWKLNCPFNELLACMSESLIGIHSMWNEHFGISVVEQIAGGNVMISHNSGGPMMDIVVDAHPATDSKGFLCETVEEYAEAIVRVINLSKQERHGIVIRAKEQSTRFSEESFEKSWNSQMDLLVQF